MEEEQSVQTSVTKIGDSVVTQKHRKRQTVLCKRPLTRWELSLDRGYKSLGKGQINPEDLRFFGLGITLALLKIKCWGGRWQGRTQRIWGTGKISFLFYNDGYVSYICPDP